MGSAWGLASAAREGENMSAEVTGSHGPGPGTRQAITIRNVVMALIGAAVLVLAPAYDGPLSDVLSAYGGNVAVSFALYFAALNATDRYRRSRLLAASVTLLAVELFEATDGFGVMANVYDRGDFAANAAGVAVGLLVDLALSRTLEPRDDQA
jgi:hypothetical protein